MLNRALIVAIVIVSLGIVGIMGYAYGTHNRPPSVPAKYLDKSFKLFDETFGVKVTAPSAFAALTEVLREFDEEGQEPEPKD